jgi:hypothetical protein
MPATCSLAILLLPGFRIAQKWVEGLFTSRRKSHCVPGSISGATGKRSKYHIHPRCRLD